MNLRAQLTWSLVLLLGLTVRALPYGLAAGTPPRLVGTIPSAGPVQDLAISPDRNWLAISARQLGLQPPGSAAVTVHRLDGASPPRVLEQARGPLLFSPVGQQLASAGTEGARAGFGLLWEVSTGQRLSRLGNLAVDLHGGPQRLAFSPNGEWLASSFLATVVALPSGAQIAQLQCLDWPENFGACLAFSPGGTRLAVANARNEVVKGHGMIYQNGIALFDSGRLARAGQEELVPARQRVAGAPPFCWGQDDLLLAAQPDAGQPVGFDSTAYKFHRAALFTSGTGACIAQLPSHPGTVTCVAASPEGSWLASGADDGTVWVWDARTHTARARSGGHPGLKSLISVAGGRALAALDSHAVTVWDGSGRLLLQRQLQATTMTASPLPGELLAVGCQDGQTLIWDFASP